MRIDAGTRQIESEIGKKLAGCRMVGEEVAIKKDDPLHAIGRPGARHRDLRDELSRYRIVARHMHSNSSAHYIQKDMDATGVI
jgi:hypothetical protein